MLMMAKCAPLVGFDQGGGGLNIANLFATSLYTGNGGTQTITNGIDLATRGGMVWGKNRGATANHRIHDTIRTTGQLASNTTDQSFTNANAITAFNADGFTLGNGNLNTDTASMVAWVFAEAPRFFDIVTWTGDDVNGRVISHSLGTVPGLIIVKRTDTTSDWVVWHRSSTVVSSTNTNLLFLNTTAAGTSAGDFRGSGAPPTSTNFTVSNGSRVNASGGTYVAHLFAHDTAADGVVQCGSYTGNGSTTGPTITLGWQPQWLLIKGLSSSRDWNIYDAARDTSNPRNAVIIANSSDQEYQTSSYEVDFNSTGFQLKMSGPTGNSSGETYVYTAIRAAA